MAISLTTVTGPLYMPNGQTPLEGRVSFELSSWDRQIGEALITSGPVYADIDLNGNFSVELFTSTLGVNTVNYKMYVHWVDSTFVQKYENNTYNSLGAPRYVKEYIGSFALSGNGPFRVSDLNIVSELVSNSFDIYQEIQAHLLSVGALVLQVEEDKIQTELNAAASATSAERANDAATTAALYDGIRVDTFAGLAAITPVVAAVGKYIQVRATGATYQVVASGGDLNYTGTGGVRLAVVPGENGFNARAFGVTADLTDETAIFQAALDAVANMGTVAGQYTVGGGPVNFVYGEARVDGQLEFRSEAYLQLGTVARGGVLHCYSSTVALSFGWNADGTVGQRVGSPGIFGGRLVLYADGATALGVKGAFGGECVNTEINLRGSNQVGLRAHGYNGIGPYYFKLDGLEVRGTVGETGNIGLLMEEDPASGSAVSRGPNRWTIPSLRHISTVQHGADIRAADGMTIGQAQFENLSGTAVRWGFRPGGPDYSGACTSVNASKAIIDDTSFVYGSTFTNCAVSVTSGANAGFCRNIQSAVSGSLTFSQAWPYDFTIGDTFEIFKLTALNAGIQQATCETADTFADFTASAANCYAYPTMVTQATGKYLFKRGVERMDNRIHSNGVVVELQTTIAASTTKYMDAFVATTRGGIVVGRNAFLDAVTITGAARGAGTLGTITAKVLVNGVAQTHEFNGTEVDFTAVLTANSPSDYTYVRRSLKTNQIILPGQNIHVTLTSSADLVGTETVKVILHLGYL